MKLASSFAGPSGGAEFEPTSDLTALYTGTRG